jgi:hypothetical protein
VAEAKVTAEEALKLAREIVAEHPTPKHKADCVCMICEGYRPRFLVAQALIERMEPVKISPDEDYRLVGICPCGEICSLDNNYCSGCGKALQWT